MALNTEVSKQAILDREIVKDVLSGNTGSFQKITTRYNDIIFYTLLKMVYSKKIANELTAEVFSRAYQNLSSYSKEYAFSTWLFSIANNRGIDYIRRKKTNTVAIEENKDDYESVILADNIELQPDMLLMKQQVACELRDIVDCLKPSWKELIEMRYYQELSYEEIAEKLNQPLGTVKNQIYRAKQKLVKLAEVKNFEN